MVTETAFLTAGSTNYLPGLIAFLNSLVYYKHTEDVLLLSFRLPEEFLSRLKEYPFNIRVIESPSKDQIEGTAIERFKVAADYGKEYKAIAFLEGDICLTGNVENFFEAAKREVIITGSNGMIVNFGKGYQKQYNLYLDTDDYVYPNVHTTVPIFLSSKDLDWFSEFYKGRMSARSFDDVFGLNLLGIKMGKSKRMIAMPPTTFTQIHHFGIKPVTGLIRKGDLLLDGFEQQVFMIHGKWWDWGWYSGLMDPMEGYFHDNAFGDRQRKLALYSRDITLQEFVKHAYRKEFSIRDFEKIEWLEKKIVEKGWKT